MSILARHPHPGSAHSNGPVRGGTVAAIAVAVPEDIPFRFFEEGITPLRYPVLYAAFITVATLDIAFTWVILSLGGVEVNPVARLVIDAWALNGAIAFKYALTLFVIVLCEAIGRHRDRAGRMLAVAAVVISAVPVIWSSSLLLSLATWL